MNMMAATLPPQALKGIFRARNRPKRHPAPVAGDRNMGEAPGVTQNAGGEGVPPRLPDGRPLGGSMRQPFDYEEARKVLVGEPPKIKDWQKVAAIVGDALMANSGGQPWAARALAARQDQYAQQQRDASLKLLDWKYGDWKRQNEADLQASNPFTIGRERLGFDPATGETQILYRGQQDAEIYADNLGFDRGSDEWNAAVEDYVLRGSGPSAHARDIEMDDHRTGNDRSMEGYRQSNRVALERMRQGGRSSLESQRQNNRMTIRQTPPARSSSGAMPVVSSPDEARRLPPGTSFRVKGSSRVLRTPGG